MSITIEKYKEDIFSKHNKILKEYKKTKNIKYNHIINMIDCLLLRSKEFTLDKYFRWFGLIQGYLFNEKILDFHKEIENKNLNIDKEIKIGIYNFKDYQEEIKKTNIIILKSYKKYCQNLPIKDLHSLLIIQPELFTLENHSKLLGFVQAYLIYNNIIPFDEDFSENLFNKIYQKFNLKGISQFNIK